jgi:very-short-patch-repair endonuclease
MGDDIQGRRLRSRRELMAGGEWDRSIARSVRNGDLGRVVRGWYVSGPTPSEDQAVRDRIAAMLQRAPTLTGSHESAIVVHGLPLVYSRDRRVHLTRDATSGARRDTGRVVHARTLAEHDVVEVDGLRVTSIARTLVDLACASPDGRTVVAAADAALCSRRVRPEEVATALAAAGFRTGIARARMLLAFADGRAESPGESVLRWLLAEAGLPGPELQVEIFSPDGRFLARVDFVYLECGVVIEFDGRTKYHQLVRPGEDVTTVVLREKAREDALREAGLAVIRIVWADFADPRGLVERIQRARERGRASVAAGLVTARCRTTPRLGLTPAG